MTVEASPHDYEPGEKTSQMQTDPHCAVCGEREGYYLHAPLPAFSKIMNEMLG